MSEAARRNGIETVIDGAAVPEATVAAAVQACEGSAPGLNSENPASPDNPAVPPVVVTTTERESVIRVAARADDVRAALETEDGRYRTLTVEPGDESAECRVPAGLPGGYHTADVVISGESAACTVIVAPDVLPRPAKYSTHRHWGYEYTPAALRSDLSWGIGDYADLAEFANLASGHGASFIATTPMLAPAPVTPLTSSPYAACTGEFLNPLLIRIEDIREVAYMPIATRSLIDWEAADRRAANYSPDRMDFDEAFAAKLNALEMVFDVPRSPDRAAAFDRFVQRSGRRLQEFCKWNAAAEYFGAHPERWPAAVRDDVQDDSLDATVAAFERQAGRRRLFYAWLQWIADEQLRAMANRADGVEVVASTVVSAALAPAEAWRYRDRLAAGVRAGTDPAERGETRDDVPARSALGPAGLRETGFASVIDGIRAALRYAGGLRLDHPGEMFSSWWVPDGADNADGTRIALDADELLSIVVLEAERADAFVYTGNTSGLTPEQRKQLAARGIAVPTVVWDEAADGALTDPEHWPVDGVAVVSPHEAVPTPAFLSGEHVATDDEQARLSHERLRATVADGLTERGIVSPDGTERHILEGLYEYAGRTPARFVVVPLADAVGDRTGGYGSSGVDWRMPVHDGAGQALTLGRFAVNPRASDLAAGLNRAR